jgi:hypothetical protein
MISISGRSIMTAPMPELPLMFCVRQVHNNLERPMTRKLTAAVFTAFLAVAFAGNALAQDQTKSATSTKAKSKSKKPKGTKGTNSTVRQPTTPATSSGAEGSPGETSGPAPKQN